MYSILYFTKDNISAKSRYLVRKLTGVYIDGLVSRTAIRLFNRKLLKYDRFFLLVRKDRPAHYAIVINPLKGYLQFEGDWLLLPFVSLGSPIERFISMAVNDNDGLNTIEAVISFLHDYGGSVRNLLHERKTLPL